MHGFIWGTCMVLFRGACMVLFGGHAWFYSGGGGVCGFIWGACMVLFRGVHVFFSFFGIQWDTFNERAVQLLGGACIVALGGGHAWSSGGGCLHGFLGGHAWFFRWDTVNEQVVRILLECIPVGCIPPAPWLYLRISLYPMHAPPRSNHTQPPPGATTYAPQELNLCNFFFWPTQVISIEADESALIKNPCQALSLSFSGKNIVKDLMHCLPMCFEK